MKIFFRGKAALEEETLLLGKTFLTPKHNKLTANLLVSKTETKNVTDMKRCHSATRH